MRNDLFRTTLATLFFCCLLSLSASAFAEIRLEKAMPEGGKVVLTFDTDQLQTMTEIPFRIELIGGTGKILKDAAVSLRTVMQAMAMQTDPTKAIWKDNAYHGQAVFTMGSEWKAMVLIQRPGHDPVDLTFKLGEVQMK